MTGELLPSGHRVSDDERERAIEHLRGAIGTGRLSLEEFEHRIEPIYHARTHAELVSLVADVVPGYAVRDQVALRVTSGSLRRTGQWVPPRRLVVDLGSGQVKLDFTEALVPHPEIRVDVTVKSGQVLVVMPPGGTADVDDVEVRSGTVTSRVPGVAQAGGLHVRVSGSVRSGQVKVRYQRRFWRWRW